MNTMTKEKAINKLHLQERLQQVMTLMLQAEDAKHAQQLKDIVEKLKHGELNIAICGHYSAGKSSLINALSGKDYLPSGPIPASANVVTIRGGELASYVTHVKQDGDRLKKVQVEVDELHDYCLNGTDIASVELHVPSSLLQKHQLAMLDTPGIDSTDERHQAATDAALHLADVVFYVVDYNHVESENNLSFSRKMKELGKPLYLLINQIDKHRERELSIDQFRERVAASFREWDADPAHIFLLSVKQQAHRYSEWEAFIWLLQQLGERRHDLMQKGALDAAQKCIADHVQLVMERTYGAERESLLARVEEVSMAEVQDELEQLSQQISQLESAPKELEATLQKEVQKLLDDANIMPAVTRDKAEAYLESQQEPFKVGLFAGKKKIEQEKQKREDSFLKELQENIDTQIDWHLQQLFEAHVDGQSAGSFQIKLTAADLKEQLKPGAVVSGQYTIQYCRDLAAAIQLRFRRAAWQRLETSVQTLKEEAVEQIEGLRAERSNVSPMMQAYERLAELDEEQAKLVQELWEPIGEVKSESVALDLPNMADAPKRQQTDAHVDGVQDGDAQRSLERVATDKTANAANAARDAERSHALQQSTQGQEAVEREPYRAKLEGAANRLEAVAHELAELPAMRETAQYLQAKAERLQANRFTIALFGAFSAGKSSFVNTLLGSDVVPVSPHPTTAVVNRIVPATKEFPSGTAVIQMKSEQQLKEEFSYAFELLGLRFQNLEQAIDQIRKLKPEALEGNAKVQLTFLKAAAAGWEEMNPLLGETLQVGQDEFRTFAAEEQRSCFVEAIDLYHQSALTEQGIVLVDTPGADSVNARHTGVAFNYIKNADAIIYVTYYNHAFSRADREFLLQLGRVKDNFALDKMFFLVNAADLAQSEEELEMVVDHVTSNLAACDIRNPKIYPISSLQALEAKVNGDAEQLEHSGLPPFEQDFYSFVWEELADVLASTANEDIRECVQTLDQWRLSLTGELPERERKKAQLLDYKEKLPAQWQSRSNDLQQTIEGEAKEWMYYVKQRVLFRFGETFSSAFHPSTLSRQDGDIRARLRLAWMELISILSIQCSQEVLAITLKIENLLQQKVQEQQAELLANIRNHVPSYPGFEPNSYSFATAPVEEQLDIPEKSEKWLMKHFKNAKSFFEQGGRDALRTTLEVELMAYVSDYVDDHTERFITHYAEQLAKLEEQLHEQRVQTFESHVDAIIESLTDHRLEGLIAEKKSKIEQLLKTT